MNNAATFTGFEERVRHRAYALWESEGRPFGRDADHWRASEDAARAEMSVAAPLKKAAKPKAPRKHASRRPAPVLEMSASL